MRVAVISTPFVSTPPRGYGGIELFCYHLAQGLLRRGHDVTLFATGDSEFDGELKAYFPRAQWPPNDDIDVAHLRWSLAEVARRGDYDALQLNSPCGIELSSEVDVPVAYTLHHPRADHLSQVYAAHPEVHYVGISARQLELEVPLSNVSVIHHGVGADFYPVSLSSKAYVVHLGRFAEEKGTHLAIEAARSASIRIVLAGRVHPSSADQLYYAKEVLPRLRWPGVKAVGEADHQRKVALLRGARALLCPIQWEEPFGLIAVEAMLTGTPVIGFPRGSFPEIIDHGITGLLVSDVPEMARAIQAVRNWDRRRCARRARERFSAERMFTDYERLFLNLADRRGNFTVTEGASRLALGR